ncbi:MAG TPA: TPM domain-containing protein, partial [Candidatus Polarisedimenticolaceae bacterium]|nr:TPM domain-containing protein [Candidatus Polarisedimenticolaceae bacterium]
MIRRVLALAACAFLAPALATPALAFDVPAAPLARVNDFGGILDPQAERTIEGRLADFERESSSQVVVVTIPSLDGDAIEDLAVRIVEKWGLGQKERNNGVLLLIAVRDRRAKIEVGYGLEDRLTDALSRRILEDRLFPAFREKDYAGGVLATCDGIIEATRGAYVAAPPKRRRVPPAAVLVPLAILVVFILLGLQGGSGLTRRGRRRYYRSGPIWWGGPGGFGGGG